MNLKDVLNDNTPPMPPILANIPQVNYNASSSELFHCVNSESLLQANLNKNPTAFSTSNHQMKWNRPAAGHGPSVSYAAAHSTMVNSSQPESVASSGVKKCQWQRPLCNQVFADEQALYDHVNEFHIGRKKTDNLCLSCHWKNCTVVCTKRDHITSHIKVHVPVKPYKCQKCSRAFKRAQDLTKHARSHDEVIQPQNILLKTPMLSRNGSMSGFSSTNTETPDSLTEMPSSDHGLDGYMSDPGPAEISKYIWKEKSISNKRKRAAIDHYSEILGRSFHFRR